MNEGNLITVVIVSTTILLCLTAVLLQRYKSKKILKALNCMLDLALDASFTEHSFDESLLSSIESRLNRYLTTSAISARNLIEEKEKIKELITDISHQTKTPLANILLYVQLLEERALSEESNECVTALRGQAERLSNLITSLIKLSRLETGVFILHPASNAIAPMLKEVVEQFGSLAARKELQLTMNATGAYAVFDYKWTLEALCNLVDNSIKYTPEGGRIEISVKEYDFFCRIAVTDTGIGITEQEQAKIFTRFYRSPSVSEQDGVGIGLYLTRQILNEQGGYIKVASSFGNGSVFSMFIPRNT